MGSINSNIVRNARSICKRDAVSFEEAFSQKSGFNFPVSQFFDTRWQCDIQPSYSPKLALI